MEKPIVSLKMSCPSFGEHGEIPKKHTGFGEDISPQLLIDGLMNEAKSLAIIMDDLDIPLVGAYNHWLIWNLPPEKEILEAFRMERSAQTEQGRASLTAKTDTVGQSSHLTSKVRTGIALRFLVWIAF